RAVRPAPVPPAPPNDVSAAPPPAIPGVTRHYPVRCATAADGRPETRSLYEIPPALRQSFRRRPQPVWPSFDATWISRNRQGRGSQGTQRPQLSGSSLRSPPAYRRPSAVLPIAIGPLMPFPEFRLSRRRLRLQTPGRNRQLPQVLWTWIKSGGFL